MHRETELTVFREVIQTSKRLLTPQRTNSRNMAETERKREHEHSACNSHLLLCTLTVGGHISQRTSNGSQEEAGVFCWM